MIEEDIAIRIVPEHTADSIIEARVFSYLKI